MSIINQPSSIISAARSVSRPVPFGLVDVDEEQARAPVRQTFVAAAGASLLRDIEQNLRRAEARSRGISQWLLEKALKPHLSQAPEDSVLVATSREEENDMLAAGAHLAASSRRQQVDNLHIRLQYVDPSTLTDEDERDLRARCADALRTMLPLSDMPTALRWSGLAEVDEGYVSDDDATSRGTAVEAEQKPAGWQHDLFDDIFDLIRELDTKWLSRFSDVLTNYVNFFNRLTDALSGLKDAITGTDDKGNLEVNFDKVKEALNDLIKPPALELELGGNFATEADAKKFLEELGIEGVVVAKGPGGTWQLKIDSELIAQLNAIFPEKDQVMNPASHAALISLKDSLMERFNHINRVLPDKYQRQLQAWDTLVKTLSGTIDSMGEATRLIMQNIA